MMSRHEITFCNIEQVEERLLVVDDLTDADEAFCTGTAVGVVPVGSITYQGKRWKTRHSFLSLSPFPSSPFYRLSQFCCVWQHKYCRFEFGTGATVTTKLRTTRVGIQTGIVEDKMGWTCTLDWELSLHFLLSFLISKRNAGRLQQEMTVRVTIKLKCIQLLGP